MEEPVASSGEKPGGEGIPAVRDPRVQAGADMPHGIGTARGRSDSNIRPAAFRGPDGEM
ncbi:hypothetical protein GCM10027168_28420 [Streptomyces capparidis]